MSFKSKLKNIVEKNNSLLCVGLDANMSKLPEIVKNSKNAQFEFNKAIVDATHDLVCAYKPNAAFYEQLGETGLRQLKMTMDYLNEKYPEIVTIYDAKRGDIGNTNNGYLQSAFDYFKFDSITLHPYMGKESLQPFLNHQDKGLFFLARTSNPGAGEFQDLIVDRLPLYKKVSQNIAETWNENENCCLVVGATYQDELAEVRKIVGNIPLLIPGIGAQGGDVEKTVKAGLNSEKAGMIINSSRGIIFASSDDDFAENARIEAKKLKDQINEFRG